MKKTLVAVCAMWVSCAAFADAWTDPSTGITWTYTVSDGKASVGGGSSSSPAVPTDTTGAITIPSKLGGCPVTSIGDSAFSGCSGLTSIVIPSSVTSIGDHAFYNCSGLTSVTIPEGVTSIGMQAFAWCSGLSSVTIPSSVSIIKYGVFEYCAGLTSVTIREGVTSIGTYAFRGCELTNVTIPDSVMSIDSGAFSCGGFGDGVIIVSGCLLGVNGKCPSEVVIPDGVRLIANGAFGWHDSLRSVTIPASVTRISNGAFEYCKGLTNVVIPASVTTIGSGSFLGCSSLTRMELPAGVTSIDGHAFADSGLTNVTIPDSVMSIGFCAFLGCSGLGNGVVIRDGCVMTVNGDCPSSVVLPEGTRLIAGGAFSGCHDLEEIAIPSSVKSIGNYAFAWCSGLASVEIPEGVTSLGEGMFSSCDGLLSVVIPEGVTNIGDHAFSNCHCLEEVSIPSSVKSIGDYAFSECALTSVVIPEGVQRIGNSAFEWCGGLEEVSIPSSVTIIGVGAFLQSVGTAINVADGNQAYSSCDGVLFDKNKIRLICCPLGKEGLYTIPSGVTSIGDYAFADCCELTGVTIPIGVTSIGDYAFAGCGGLTSVAIPDSVTNIGDSAFSGCTGLTSVTIPDGVTSIGSYAFCLCSGLTSVTIPSSVTSIGDSAFEYCSGLTSVTIPSSVTSIGYAAFYGCSGLTNVVLWCEVPTVGDWAFDGVANGCSATIMIRAEGYDDDGDGMWQGLVLHLPPVAFSAVGYEGIYDGNGHGISVSITDPAEGAVVSYGLTEAGPYTTLPILITNVTEGARNVYFRITAGGYATANGVATVNIMPMADGVYTEKVDGIKWTYTVRGGKVSVGGGDCDSPAVSKLTEGAVAVPSMLGGCRVTGIAEEAFSSCGGITHVTIPSGVVEIGDCAFLGCRGLQEIIVASDNAKYVSQEGVLYDWSMTTLVAYPGGKTGAFEVPPCVIRIMSHAFRQCQGLTKLMIPPMVMEIGNSAFEDCNRLDVLIFKDAPPDGVVRAGIKQDAAIQYNSSYQSEWESVIIQCGWNNSTPYPLLEGGPYHEVVDGVSWAFMVNDNLEAIVGTGEWGGTAISQLTSGDIVIPRVLGGRTVTGVAEHALRYCRAMTSVTIPSSVRSVGRYAFSNCDKLSAFCVDVANTNYKSENGLLLSKDGTVLIYGVLGDVVIPSSVRCLWSYAFDGCCGLKSVTIPSSVTEIPEYAFRNCSGLTSVTMSKGVRSIGDSAFYQCSELTRVIIPDGVTCIDESAFFGCSSLTSVSIPSSVGSIGHSAFESCGKLTSVEMSRGVVSIGAWAFAYCYGLRNVVIPSGVTSIGEYAFGYCSGLRSVTMPSSVTSIGSMAFYYCSNLDSVTIPACVNKIKETFSQAYTHISNVTFADGVSTLGPRVFTDCNGLKYITIPDSVSSVDPYAFYGCVSSIVAYVPYQFSNIDALPLKCKPIQRVKVCVKGEAVQYTYDGTAHGPSWEYSPDIDCVYTGSNMCFDVGHYELSATTNEFCYDSDKYLASFVVNGASIVTVDKRHVALFPVCAEKVYDGLPLCAGCSVGGQGFVDGECEVSTMGSQTCVGFSTNEVKLTWIGKGKTRNYDLATTNGLLTVTARPVGITARSGEKIYDGAPLTAGLEIGGMGFVEGECEVVATGSQTNVGSSKNGVQLNWIGAGKASNYDLAITNGTLTVLPAKVAENGEEPGSGEIPEGGLSKFDAVTTYDGGGHTIDTNDLMAVTLIDPKAVTYSLTSNGVYQVEPILFTNVCATSVWYKISAANYEDYVHEARVTILPREVALTSGSAEKKYDGMPLVCHGYTIGGDGFVEGEGIEIAYAGSQTLLGESENTFTYAFAEGTLADNYEVDMLYGTLTVTCAGKFEHLPQIIEHEFAGESATVHFAPVGEGVTIHYTTDGSVPTSSSKLYDGEIVVTDTTRIRAFASAYGWSDSDVSDEMVRCTAGVVDGDYASVAERYPYSYTTLTNVSVSGKAKLTAAFFAGCTALRSVTLGNDLQSIDCDAFDALPDLEWQIVDGYKYCSNWLFGYTDDAIEDLSHADTLKGVANGALQGCTAIHYFTCEVGSELKHIGTAAFKECVKLERVLLPEGVVDIGNEAFYGCTKMANFIIPGTVRTIGASAFKRCTSLTGALFGYGIESIGDEAFFDDWRISEADIPSTVTNIGSNAFGGDSSMIRAGLRCDIGKKMSDIFSHYANIREITVKAGDGEMPDGCFDGCKELDAVRYLGDCPKLENDGARLYTNAGPQKVPLVSYVTQGSTGWDGVEKSEALPQAWPLVGTCRKAIAFWDRPTYLCQFDSNGGTLGVQDTYQYSEENVVLPPEPVQSGYQFAGWWTQPIGGLRVTGDTIFIEGVYTYLYAHWIKGHWVFLDPNGGEVANDFVTYVEESMYGVLPTPVRSGYAFGGWLYDGRVIEPETEINKKTDHTLVAQWTANLYSVRYNPNGGVGAEDTQGYVYGVEQALRKNTYTRSGHAFVGWSTNGTDEVVYRDCEVVSNMTAVADGFVELYAVWEARAIADPTNVAFTFGGDEEWEMCYEDVVVTNAGEELRYDTIWKSGTITHDQSSVLKANVNGPGTIAFWWKVSSEQWRTMKLDYLEFAVDGVPREPWINGETEWQHMEFEVAEAGEHVLTWTYAKDDMGTEGEDCGRVCAVVWTPRLGTLADYLNCTNLTFSTSGDAAWAGDTATNYDGVASLKSGRISDGGQSAVETTVEGAGKMSFWWKVSSETFRQYQVDYVAFYVDGDEKAWIGGEVGWTNIVVSVEGAGAHTLTWIYQKDSEPDTSAGDDCAWLDRVAWEVVATMPTVPGDPGATVTGDAESGYVVQPSAGKTAVEVTIPPGVDAKKVTVVVGTDVETVKPNGAKVKVVKGADDITAYLDFPPADANGAVDLTKATVKEQIVKEALDPEAGAVVQLSVESPSITTAETKPGLTYTFSEGTTLEGLTQKASKLGDGQPWTPTITVKGGTSGFYSIGVEK